MTSFINDIEKCIEVLKNGGLILHPTDTIWGIGCDATNEDGVAKVYALKKRPDEKSLIVLLADEKDILKYVAQPDLSVFDYLHTVTKPTTVIYDGPIGFADNLIADDNTIAIRITTDAFCKHLIKYFRKPIVSTSANVSGYASPLVFNDISETIKNGVDYIVQHRQNDLTPATASSIIKWNANGTPAIIRP
ncbi:MAG: L-threonylcarbamoyladenylate synthase [Ferruginibacter sp.]